MMRLSPPGFAKFSQATNLDLAYGGGEANVAISLAYMGMEAAHVTRFPDNLIGKAATQFLRHHWLDTSHIIYGDEHIGKYFLEKGAVHRSSQVVYEREGSAFARIQADMVDWEHVFQDADWFHWTGITPGISQGAADCCARAIEVANKLGVKVSADIHSRKNLWQYGKTAREVMPTLINGSDVVLAGAFDVQEYYDLDISEDKNERFKEAAQTLMQKHPRITHVFDKDREMVSASHNRIQGKLWNGHEFFKTSKLNVTHIVDRVGTGDAYAAGVIYGLLNYADDFEALKFATAACALKHTVEGDANMVSVDNVIALMDGNTTGKIIR